MRLRRLRVVITTAVVATSFTVLAVTDAASARFKERRGDDRVPADTQRGGKVVPLRRAAVASG